MTLCKRLTFKHLAWLHFLTAIGVVWPLLTLFVPSSGVSQALDRPLISILMLLTLLGGITSIVGILMSVRAAVTRTISVSIELIGLILLSLGPAMYFVTQFFLAIVPPQDFSERIALLAFAYSMCAVLAYRFAVVTPRFIQEAKDKSKIV